MSYEVILLKEVFPYFSIHDFGGMKIVNIRKIEELQLNLMKKALRLDHFPVFFPFDGQVSRLFSKMHRNSQ